jgi:hypothetical protein
VKALAFKRVFTPFWITWQWGYGVNWGSWFFDVWAKTPCPMFDDGSRASELPYEHLIV